MNARPRVVVYTVVAVALTALAVAWRYRGAAPLGEDAPGQRFSASRARRTLSTLLGDSRPHPVGSPANDAVRARLVAELERIGYRPETQSFRHCLNDCFDVVNVIAELKGNNDASSVLLCAHYDSATGGPGAADDGSGVAIALEVARILRQEPTPPRSVIFLFDDGEEAGLLGAETFLREHPMAHRTGIVVNLEARGTSGPSLMFETSGDSAWLVPLFARAVARPITSSLFASVYQHMPNDTNLSAFRRHGIPGYNFAFIGDAENYHARTDDLSHLSSESLQHQGDNALSLVRALVAADPTPSASGDSVFFDVLARWVIHWRSARSPFLFGACVALLVAALAIRRLTRSDKGQLTRALLVWPVTIVAALALGLGLGVALGNRTTLATIWPEHALFPLGAIGASAITAGFTGVIAAGRTTTPLAISIAVTGGWLVAALGAMIFVPGAEYAALVPGLATALGAVALAALGGFGARRRASLATSLSEWTIGLSVVPQALVLLPVYWLLYPAIGLYSVPALVLAFATGGVVVGPALSCLSVRARVIAALCSGVLSLVCVGGAIWAG